MPAKLGMVFSSGYDNNTTNTQNNEQNNSMQQNTIMQNTQYNMQNNILLEQYQLKRMRLCMDLYGLMAAKPCGSCGGNG
tara:strand:- start:30 stop:266 length:237 start_codon:yes stop_codon:yes gene_type:complete